MRRIVVSALTLAVAAGPAAAQPSVHGAASFRTAPLLEPGEHRDTIRPGETLFYAVGLDEGEVVSVRAILRSRERHSPLETRLRLYNVRRVEDAFAHDAGFVRAPGTLGLRALSGRVGAPNPDYPEAGTHYFSVSVLAPRGRLAAELDLSLGIVVKDAELPEPLPVKQEAPVDELPEPSRTGTYLLALLGGTVAGGLGAFGVSKVRQPPAGLRHRL